jgi:DNA-binding Xre family transcriptional regulator
MASTQTLIELIKAELKAAGLSYADLAHELALSESSIKRMFASGGEMPLSRVDEICRVLHCDFAELTAKLAQPAQDRRQLTLEQERALVADPKLLLVAICCLSQWTFEQMLAAYRINGAETTAALTQLDRLGIIELRPGNRYKLLLTKTLRWHPQGPVIRSKRSESCSHVNSHGYREALLVEVFMNNFGRVPDRSANSLVPGARSGRD